MRAASLRLIVHGMRKIIFVLSCLLTLSALAQGPETILGIARPKPGKEAELLQAIQADHATMDRLGLITGPYTLYRADDEGGQTAFIVIFTWKSADIPENAPPEIRQSWKRMGALIAKQNGCPGSEFWAITTVAETAKDK